MITYTNIKNSADEVSQRQVYSMKYVKPGQVVAYIQEESGWENSSGVIRIEKGDKLPWGMTIYEPTSTEIFEARVENVRNSWMKNTQGDCDKLLDMLYQMIVGNKSSGACDDVYNLKQEITLLPWVIRENDRKDFAQKVWAKCKNEIGAVGMNFDRRRAEDFNFLLAVSFITGSDFEDAKRKELAILLDNNWDKFSMIYSLFYGRNITTGHKRFNELFSYAVGVKRYENYLHLFLIALGDKKEKVEKIVRYSPVEDRKKLLDKIGVIERMSVLMNRHTDLDELFNLLFPKTLQDFISKDNPYASIEEMQEKLRMSEETIRMQEKICQYAEYLRSELDNAIKMENLSNILLKKCNPATAYTIFSQLDMVLEGENEVWDKFRKQLKVQISDRYNQSLLAQNVYNAGAVHNDYRKTLCLTTPEPAAPPVPPAAQDLLQKNAAPELQKTNEKPKKEDDEPDLLC